MFGSTESVKKIVEKKTINPYAVKAVKSFMGREGYGYECSLYKDGKRIGTVTDTCDGGGMLQCNLKDGEEEKLEAYCDALPPTTSKIPLEPAPREGEYKGEYEDFTIDIDPCIFVSGLVEEWETKAQYKKWCKNKTVFCIDGDKEGEFRTIKHIFCEKVKTYLDQTYPDCGLRILNEEI